MIATQPHGTSRRHFLGTAALLAAATALTGPRRLLMAHEEKPAAGEGGVVQMMRGGAAKAKVSVEKVRGNVSALIGSGGNIAVLTGKDGKLLVDSGLAGSQPQIRAALAKLGEAPVRHLVNTHWHFDHTDGNAWLHEAGAAVVAHENTAKHLSTDTRVEDWNFTFPPAPKAAMPTVLVKDEHAIELNGTKAAIRYYGPCHTDGDLSVFFPDADVLATGDTFWNGHYPFIDYGTGGSINGTIRAVGDDLQRVTDKTLIIPGHGPVGGKRELTEYRDMLVAVRDAVARLKKAGKSVEEAVAAKPTQKFDEKFGGFVITPEHMVRLAYRGV